jgi:ketosteroid isomerase-like protein
MSEENVGQRNVNLVLDGYDRFNAGGGDLEWRLATLPDAVASRWNVDGEYHTDARDPDSAIHRGTDAISRHFASWFEAYPDLEVKPLEVKANGDQVFLRLHFIGHGAESGIPIEMELFHVVTVRDGRFARTVEYSDRTEALEAVGLSEQKAPADS